MKLHFDPNQRFQLDAIDSIVDLFEGQPLGMGDFTLQYKEEYSLFQAGIIGNQLYISKKQILKNLQEIQKRNEIPISDELDGIHFSIEMETGTGKTYVYLRSIYELNKKYGFKKFVIVVPSIAIKEGVLKNLEITEEHFQNLYNNTPVNYYVYNSTKISNLRSFASNNSIQILVINIDSFAKDENIINRSNDKLVGKIPIEFIQSTNPIVIVDEPQNMETEKRKKAIDNLNSLCTLRYSATHIKKYNMVYSLDPVRAYDLGLVKQIEVDSIVTENDFNDAFIQLEKVTATKTRTSAKVRIDINSAKGVKRQSKTVKVGDDLFNISNKRELYKDGYIINGIDIENEFIELSNGTIITVGSSLGDQTDEIMKTQIYKTVEEHLWNEKRFSKKGIKILTLFFIDRVANYRKYNSDGKPEKGKFALWFEEAYKSLSSKALFKDLNRFDVEDIHNGYFAQDKNGHWKNTKGNSKADDSTYHLIMKHKERLLDIKEPLRFIFSHSALREGWDNPNVFQICTLNETKSELKKRQEIGRGLRLPVNQGGNRVFEKNINHLTVIANESYEDFAKKLQTEIEDECGVSFEGRIKNKNKRKTVKYRKGFELDNKFKAIWDKIKYQTTYKVEYETEELIHLGSASVSEMSAIAKAEIKIRKASVKMSKAGVTTEILATGKKIIDETIYIPEVLFYIEERTGLTRSTIMEILKESGRLNDLLINPQLFLDNVVMVIKKVLQELMIDGIKYERIGTKEYEMRLFEEYEIHKNNLTFEISKKDKTIYGNLVPLDSTVEYEFAKECETRDDIEFYFKLPFWFKINTPIGSYNPDWALIKKNEKTVYFIAETKSKDQELRVSEQQKIKCGAAHFKEFREIEFKQVTQVEDLD